MYLGMYRIKFVFIKIAKIHHDEKYEKKHKKKII